MCITQVDWFAQCKHEVLCSIAPCPEWTNGTWIDPRRFPYARNPHFEHEYITRRSGECRRCKLENAPPTAEALEARRQGLASVRKAYAKKKADDERAQKEKEEEARQRAEQLQRQREAEEERLAPETSRDEAENVRAWQRADELQQREREAGEERLAPETSRDEAGRIRLWLRKEPLGTQEAGAFKRIKAEPSSSTVKVRAGFFFPFQPLSIVCVADV